MQRKVNDVGGLPGNEIDRHEHDPNLHEKRIDAMLMLLTSPAVNAFSVDSLRRSIEENTQDDYTKKGYYEKWLLAIRKLLVEQHVLTNEEIDARMQQIRVAKVQTK